MSGLQSDIVTLYRTEDSEDALWEKLLHFSGKYFGVTSVLYGFTHSKFTYQFAGITDNLYLRNTSPEPASGKEGRANLLEAGSAAVRRPVNGEPFLWIELISSNGPVGKARLDGAAAERPNVGVTMEFPFSNGTGVSTLVLWSDKLSADEFALTWQKHSADILHMGAQFDKHMRPVMIHNRLKMTPREKEVLSLATGGLSAKQIAHHLRLQPKTVFNTMHRIRKSLHAANTAEVVAKACVYGLI